MTVEEEDGRSYKNLTIKRGKRHCKIVDETGEAIFRTTNLRDAEAYLDMIEENDRLRRLLDARGIAPHRIYLLAIDEAKRGRVNLDGLPATEVVIVAKAGDEAVVVRHLEDGREEIVDLEELEPIEGGRYLQGPDATEETVHTLIRYDREAETMSVAAFRAVEDSDDLQDEWAGEDAPGSEYIAALVYSQGDVLVFRAESSIED